MSENTPTAAKTLTRSSNMKSPVAIACVFSSTLMIAQSLQCLFSYNAVPGDLETPSTEINCTPSQDACILIFYILDKRSDKKLNGHLYRMQCTQKSNCNIKASLTTAGYYISYSTTCCYSDNCQPPQPVLPERSLVKNGVTCPACHVEKGDPCVPKRAMACTGEESQCVFQNTTVFKAYNAYSSGCGTKTILKDKGDFMNLFSIVTKIVVIEIKKDPQLNVGHFLWCHECQEASSSTCAKYQVLCDPDRDVCLSEMRRITEDPSRRLTMEVIRRCGSSNECKLDGSITSKGKTTVIKSSCCNTDMCNPPSVIWSLKRKKSNGKMCPSYDNKNHLDSDVQCMGGESQCINFTYLINEGTIPRKKSLYGCATASICEHGLIKEYQSPSNKMSVENNITCSNGVKIISHLFHLIIWNVAELLVLKD